MAGEASLAARISAVAVEHLVAEASVTSREFLWDSELRCGRMGGLLLLLSPVSISSLSSPAVYGVLLPLEFLA